MSTQFSTLRFDVQDHVAVITLDRPPLNLIDLDSTREYLTALDVADRDRKIRAIVLKGAGKGLSAGVDIKFLREFDGPRMNEFVQLFYIEQVRRVRALHKPIIAAVHGYAREGACTMAFSCDMVIASEDASFGYPGVPNLAAPPGMHVWHLQRLLGRMRACELVLTGDPISAPEAARLGMITRMVPSAELDEQTLQLARRLARLSPGAVQATRELMYRMEDMPFDEVPEAAAAAISAAFSTPDSVEARAAFLEKREPRWSS